MRERDKDPSLSAGGRRMLQDALLTAATVSTALPSEGAGTCEGRRLMDGARRLLDRAAAIQEEASRLELMLLGDGPPTCKVDGTGDVVTGLFSEVADTHRWAEAVLDEALDRLGRIRQRVFGHDDVPILTKDSPLWVGGPPLDPPPGFESRR